MNRRGTRLVMAVGLLFLFVTCEKEIPGNAGGGKKVEILFSLNTSNYNAEDRVVRNAAVREPVTTTVPLEDGLYLQATLVPDAEEELRLDAAFKDGQKLCFAAFLTNGTPQGSEVYTYSESAGKFIPDGDPLGVTPDNVTEYRFVAYSYFDDTDTPTLTGIDPAKDLVWGQSIDTKIEDETEASRTVAIHMTHKFAQVKVQVRSVDISGATIDLLTGVSVDGGQQGELTPFSGAVAWSGSVAQGIDIASAPGVDDVSSTYRTVTPVGSGTVKVRIGNVKVSTNSTVFSGKMAEFNSTLDEATSYTLVVDLKQGLFFAFSNIFYDGTNLTFDKTEAMASDVYSLYYQGVCFKWGSLIGISPLGNGDASVLYIPNTGNKTWDNTKTIATSSFGNWGGIPCTTTNTGLSSPNDKGENYLHNNPQFSQYKGDICSYIDADWRLPNAGEFATQVSGLVGNNSIPGGNVAFNSAGTGRVGVPWYRKQISGGSLLPGWGYLSDGAVIPGGASGRGYYWTGSGGAYVYSYRGVQNDGSVGGASREMATAIRCIKK